MSELVPLLEELVKESQAGRRSALCTVIGTKGSTPQSPGAAMLLRSDFTTMGTLGGGCVEAEVRRRAYELLERNQSAVLDFVLDHDYGWDDGLICGGKMNIGVMPIAENADLDQVRGAIAAAHSFKQAYVSIIVEQEGKPIEYRLNLEVPPTLLIAGAGHVGLALAKIAVDLDFRVVVIDDRADIATKDRFGHRVELIVGDIAESLKSHPINPACYVVIVTRGHQHDHQALAAVINTSAGYVGLIGSKRKAKMIFKDLRDDGVTQDQLDRVHTPIGLNIDAVLVPEIAISIAAELVKIRRQDQPKLIEGPFTIVARR